VRSAMPWLYTAAIAEASPVSAGLILTGMVAADHTLVTFGRIGTLIE
jgi:hypothetical protein